jgi:hypothetical protein
MVASSYTSGSLPTVGLRGSRIPTEVGFALDSATNILGYSLQLLSTWLTFAALNAKAISVEARQDVKMYMKYVLTRYFAIGHPEIDTFASNVTESSCFRHLLSYLK